MPPSSSQPATTLLSIVLETRGGPELGPGLTEYASTTAIDGSAGTISFRLTKSSDDQPYPIGLFRTPLDDATRTTLTNAINAVDWSQVPAATRGGPGTTQMRLDVTSGANQHQLRFTSMDIERIGAITGLLDPITEVETRAFATPQAALSVSASHKETGEGVVFQLELKNVGSIPIALANPLLLRGEHNAGWAGVKVAPVDNPNMLGHLLEWQYVDLHRPTDVNADDIVLPPGKIRTCSTLPWAADSGRQYVFAGAYANYSGSDTANGLVRIRGSAVSPRQLEVLRP